MLTGKKELAKTSSVPGRTQLINFFEVDDRWVLVDLPGYGFAKTTKQQQVNFNLTVSDYLTGRETLKQVFALVDSHIDPQESDLEFIAWLESCGIPYSVIFTKTDRSTDKQVNAHVEQFTQLLEERGLHPQKKLRCSAKTNRGRNPILEFIHSRLPKKKAQKSKTAMNLSWMNKK
jgi:GTP-binding protein